MAHHRISISGPQNTWKVEESHPAKLSLDASSSEYNQIPIYPIFYLLRGEYDPKP